jgi:hypothetical protein
MYENNIPFYLLYEEYYHMHVGNPFYSLASMHNSPDLNNPTPGEEVDITPYN